MIVQASMTATGRLFSMAFPERALWEQTNHLDGLSIKIFTDGSNRGMVNLRAKLELYQNTIFCINYLKVNIFTGAKVQCLCIIVLTLSPMHFNLRISNIPIYKLHRKEVDVIKFQNKKSFCSFLRKPNQKLLNKSSSL